MAKFDMLFLLGLLDCQYYNIFASFSFFSKLSHKDPKLVISYVEHWTNTKVECEAIVMRHHLNHWKGMKNIGRIFKETFCGVECYIDSKTIF